MISKISTVICVLLAVPFLAYGLQCYQCNSKTPGEESCVDPFVNEPTEDGKPPEVKGEVKKFLKECPSDATICRKTDQYVRSEASTIRSCATIEYKNECYKSTTNEYNTISCTCDGDGCNHAPAALASLTTIVLMAVLAVAFK